jgi:hypothetical protein
MKILKRLSLGITAFLLIPFAQAQASNETLQHVQGSIQYTGTGTGLIDNVANVLTFGAKGDGVTDDTAAFQAAINAATASAVSGQHPFPPGSSFGIAPRVYVPPSANGYVISNLTVTAPIEMMGESPTSSRLIGKPGATGYMLSFNGFAANASTGYSSGEILFLNVHNLGFEGNSRQASYGCLYLSAIGQSHFYNLVIMDFSQEAMDFYSSVLESFFDHISIRYCGNQDTGYSAINLTDQAPAAGQRDAHNLLTFTDLSVIFSYGTDVTLDTASGRAYETREIFFEHCWFHASPAGFSEPNQTAPDTNQITHSTFVIKHATEIFLSDILVPVAGTASPVISVNDPSPSSTYQNVYIRGFVQDGRSSSTAPRTGLNIQSGYVTASGLNFAGSNEGTVVTSASGVLTSGPPNQLYAQQSFSAGTVTTPLYGITEFQGPATDVLNNLVDGASVAVNAGLGNWFFLGTGQSSITFGAPTNGTAGQTITISLVNSSGGALTVAWNAAYILASAWTGPANTALRSISFKYNGTSWYEVSRSG